MNHFKHFDRRIEFGVKDGLITWNSSTIHECDDNNRTISYSTLKSGSYPTDLVENARSHFAMSPTGDQNRLSALLVARRTGFTVFLVCYHHWSWSRLVVAWLAQRYTRSTLEHARPLRTEKDFSNPHTSRTRKRSEQVVQFFGTVKFARTPIPRYPPPRRLPRFDRSFFLPPPSSFLYSSFFRRTVYHGLTRAPTLNTGHLRSLRSQKVLRIDPARKKLFPLFFSLYSFHPSIHPFPPPRSFYFPSFHPIFLQRHQFFFLFSHLLHFLRPVVSGSPFFLQPLSPTFIRGSTAEILLFCFHLFFVRALACKARRDVAFL